MACLENFPNELLEMIVGHFDEKSDILKLFEVSPRFNNLISKSPRLMREIDIKHRNYSVLHLFYVEEYSEKFVETFADSIAKIRFWECELKMSEVHLLLSMVSSTLENLKVVHLPMLEHEILPKIEMPKLKRLRYNVTLSAKEFDVRALVSMISTSSLKSFMYGNFSTENELEPPVDATVLIDIIKRQKRLNDVFLHSSVADAIIEHWHSDQYSNSVPKLLQIDYAGGAIPAFHWKFFESPKISLRCLMMEKVIFGGSDLLNLLSLELQELSLTSCVLKLDKNREIRNDSIEILRILCYDNEEIFTKDSIEPIVLLISKCQAVRSLEINFASYHEALDPILAAIAGKTSIVQLTITNPFIVNATTFLSVKELIIIAGWYMEAEQGTRYFT